MIPIRYLLIPKPCLILLTVLALLLALPQSVTATDNPSDFIRIVGQNAINSLTNKEITQAKREDLFRKILHRTFELRLIARFALGRFWRRASKAQQIEYIALFEEFIVKAYAARFADYKGENFIVGKVRNINERDHIVQSEVVLKNGRKIVVHWRVRNGKALKIIDVLVEGVSMAITQRDQFAAIINQNGGKIAGLLSALNKKIGR
ncbi:MAG: toluene tolerance protein [Rhodospirillaceae bacterium]|nr:toluene tolerance protein [Rhodospirillaceae bacterium]